MDVYKTEEEQLDSIKKWLKENSASIAVVVMAIVGFFGGRAYWQSYQNTHNETTYEAFASVSELRDTALTDSANDTAFQVYVTSVDDLKVQKPDHALTDLAVLKVAADFAEKGLWDDAESELRWLKEQQTEPALEALVVYRLAQVLFQKEQYDQALVLIANAIEQDDDYLPRLKELQGDIYIEQGQLSKALQTYKDASTAHSDTGLTSPALQWKIDDLTGA